MTDAINARQVPADYLEDLQGVANELDHELSARCAQQQPPPPPPPPTTDEEGDGDD